MGNRLSGGRLESTLDELARVLRHRLCGRLPNSEGFRVRPHSWRAQPGNGLHVRLETHPQPKWHLILVVSTNHPGLNRKTMDKFWHNLLVLSGTIPMFPHPLDLLSAACKVARDSDLVVVAAEVTHSPYPRSIVLRTEEELEENCMNGNVVIKRDFSDSTTCTFLPARDRLRLVMEKYAETRTLYAGIQAIPKPHWMAQPFNRELAHKGELRAYVMGGKLRYTMYTWPGRDGVVHHEYVDNYTPLQFLQ
jgi:hypothetical protein